MRALRERGVEVVLEVVDADLEIDRPYFVTPWCEESLEAAVEDGRYREDPLAGVQVPCLPCQGLGGPKRAVS